jgi:hypothetical protein
MTRFFILHTAMIDKSFADFYVDFVDSQAEVGDEFLTFFTHHRKTWKIVDKIAIEDKFVLKCWAKYGLGYENEFAGASVDTNGATRIDLFRYGDSREQSLYDPESAISKRIQRIKDKRSGDK